MNECTHEQMNECMMFCSSRLGDVLCEDRTLERVSDAQSKTQPAVIH